MNKQQKFEALLVNKYGQYVTNKLYSNGELLPENITSWNKVAKIEIEKHLENLLVQIFNISNTKQWLDEYSTNSDCANNGWGFDFSGWIGKMNFDLGRLKQVMIIGTEPHIESNDFQIVYGFWDYPTGEKKRYYFKETGKYYKLGLNIDKGESRLWNHVLKLISTPSQRELIELGDQKAVKEVLEKVYVTDLCHFIPKGSTAKIEFFPKWKKRNGLLERIAEKFIVDEIKIVCPKIILGSGYQAARTTKRILDKYFTPKENIRLSEKMPCIERYNINGNEVKLITIPHLGSGHNVSKWKREIEIFREFYFENL